MCGKFFNRTKAFLVRLLLIIHNFLTVWRLKIGRNDNWMWLLLLGNLLIVIEGFISIIKHKGIEHRWIVPCFFLYLTYTIPVIWLLELDRREMQTLMDLDAENNTNVTRVYFEADEIEEQIESILQHSVNPETWGLLVKESLVYMVIIGRWFLPRGNVSRDQLSELLCTFVGIASDIMELFALFDEEKVRLDPYPTFTYVILGVWSLSLFQFSFAFSVSRRRIKMLNKTGSHAVQQHILKVEMGHVLLSICMQDGPFLAVRLYAILQYDLVTYSLVFFVMKNILVILILLYRLVVLCCKLPRFKRRFGKDKNKNSDTALMNTTSGAYL